MIEYGDVEITGADGAAVAHLLRRRPVQDRSRELVRRVLQAAAELAELAADGTYVRMETIRIRAGVNLTAVYRYLDNTATVAGCLALIWQRRMISAISGSTDTGTAYDADTLARLLIDQQTDYYRNVSPLQPGDADPLPDRIERMAGALLDLHAGAPESDWGIYCRIASQIADATAKARVLKDPVPCIAEEMANLLAWYLDERDLVVPQVAP